MAKSVKSEEDFYNFLKMYGIHVRLHLAFCLRNSSCSLSVNFPFHLDMIHCPEVKKNLKQDYTNNL